MDKQPRILLLGAMPTHLPFILRARERGVYVITSDYIKDNIGHRYSDESYYVSTTDMEAVLDLAIKCKIDGITTFCSDPASATAAYVAEKLNLPSSGYDAVSIMSRKDRFRYFLSANGFNYPHYRIFNSIESAESCINDMELPLIIKPVDSSGSKGVSIVSKKDDIRKSISYAFMFTRSNRVIIEEVIPSEGDQIHGSAFVYNGKVIFCQLGDHHFDPEINNLLPIATTWPSIRKENDLQRVKDELERFVSVVGYKHGAIDIEARINSKDDQIYLIEVGPRNGGNYIPSVMQYYSGINLMDACIDTTLGIDFHMPHICCKKHLCYYVIHSKHDGVLKEIWISEELQKHILEKHIYLSAGDAIHCGTSSLYTIGILILEYDTFEEMSYFIMNADNLCTVLTTR